MPVTLVVEEPQVKIDPASMNIVQELSSIPPSPVLGEDLFTYGMGEEEGNFWNINASLFETEAECAAIPEVKWDLR